MAALNPAFLTFCSWTTAVLDISTLFVLAGLDAQYLASLHWALSQPLSSWDGAPKGARKKGKKGIPSETYHTNTLVFSKKVATFSRWLFESFYIFYPYLGT